MNNIKNIKQLLLLYKIYNKVNILLNFNINYEYH